MPRQARSGTRTKSSGVQKPVPITNPFVNHDEYNCFGCDPNNPIGLGLTFELQTKPDGEYVTATWEPREDLEGYPGVVHGGIQATLCDEVGAWYVYAVHGKAGVTKRLEIDYMTPARLSQGPLRLSAQLAESSPKNAVVAVTLSDSAGAVCARARVEYAVFGDEVGRRRFGYPGREAFIAPAAPAGTDE